MIQGFSWLLLFQLAGEALVLWLDWPLPGPVAGYALVAARLERFSIGPSLVFLAIGIVAAVNRNRWPDRLGMALAVSGSDLYVGGEFLGGCDIVKEMFANGDLQKKLGIEEKPFEPPKVTLDDGAAAAIRGTSSSASSGAKGRPIPRPTRAASRKPCE